MSHSYQLLSLRALSARLPDVPVLSEQITPWLKHIETEATNLLDMMESPDPMKSVLAHDLRVDSEKSRLRDLIAKAGSTIAPLISTFRSKAASAQLDKAALIPDQHAQEFRNVWRGMSGESQINFLDGAMKSRDGASIAALTEAPAILSGLTAQRQQQIKDAYLESVAPSNTDELSEVQSVVSTFLQSAASLAAPNSSGRPSGSTA